MLKSKSVSFTLDLVWKNLFVIICYCIGSQLGFHLAFLNSQVSPVWPPEGIAFAFLYFYRKKVVVGIFLGAFLANYINNPHLPTSILIGIGNTLSSLLNIGILFRITKSTYPLKNIKTLLVFFSIATIPGSILSAFIGVTSLFYCDFVPKEVYFNTLFTWFAGEMQGFIIVAPFLIEVIIFFKNLHFHFVKTVEVIFVLLGISILSYFVFSMKAPMSFIPVPFLVYMTIRFKSLGALTGIVVISSFAIYHTINLRGPFADVYSITGSINNVLIYLDVYIFSITSLAYFLAVLLKEREEINAKIFNIQEEAKKTLEHKVLERTKVIEAQNLEFQRQIKTAKSVQVALLPEKIPNLENIEIAYEYIPTMDIGGDFVDIKYFYNMSGLTLFICDVSGHGIAAALVSTIVKMSLENWYKEPSKTSTAPNKVFEITSNVLGNNFVSAIFLYMDLQKNTVFYSRAGHLPLIILKADGTIQEINPRGRIITKLSPPNCEEITFQVHKGDTLVLYTDGIIEAKDKFGNMYTTERLIENIRLNKDLRAKELCSTIVKSVFDYTKREVALEDDLTILVVKI